MKPLHDILSPPGDFEWIQMTHETAAGYTVQMEWKHVDFPKTLCRKPFFPPQTNLQTPEIHIKIYWLHFVRYLFEALEPSAMILACCGGLSWISKSLAVFSGAKLPRDEASEVIQIYVQYIPTDQNKGIEEVT